MMIMVDYWIIIYRILFIAYILNIFSVTVISQSINHLDDNNTYHHNNNHHHQHNRNNHQHQHHNIHQYHQQHHHNHTTALSTSSSSSNNIIYNTTIAGLDNGCKHSSLYYVNQNTRFFMCMGITDQDLKNGMSIINLIYSRGYLPTCRVMQLMLWMSSMIYTDEHSDNNNKNNKKDDSSSIHYENNEYNNNHHHHNYHYHNHIKRDYFIDIGANIGSCSVHLASLGFPVIAVEPVKQHVNTIKGSIIINPTFHIDLQHVGLSSEDRVIKANFGHGGRNWGASEFHEVIDSTVMMVMMIVVVMRIRMMMMMNVYKVQPGENFEATLRLKTLDQVIKIISTSPKYFSDFLCNVL